MLKLSEKRGGKTVHSSEHKKGNVHHQIQERLGGGGKGKRDAPYLSQRGGGKEDTKIYLGAS